MKAAELSSRLKRAFSSTCEYQTKQQWLSQPHTRPSLGYAQTASFSTTTARRVTEPTTPQDEIRAAPPISFRSSGGRGGENEKEQGILRRIRIVPDSPSYFSGKPQFTDDLLELTAVLRKYETLPVLPAAQAPRIAWKKLADYKSDNNEPIRSSRFHRIIDILKRLNLIHPALMPQEVTDMLQKYKRAIDPFAIKPRGEEVDDYGRAKGVGRRKTSSAVAWLVEGEGEVLINGRTLTQMFGRLHDRESAIWALKATDRIDRYNVFALVRGGGVTGQAEALTLAVAKALLVHEPLLKPALRRGECVLVAVFAHRVQWLPRFFRPLLRALDSADEREEPLAARFYTFACDHRAYASRFPGAVSCGSANFRFNSRLYHTRSSTSRTEEAWSLEGQKEACVG